MYDLFTLMNHLKNCPFAFLKMPYFVNYKEGIDTNALVLDCLRGIDDSYESKYQIAGREELKSLNENYIIAVHIACWFFSHSDFVGKKAFGSNILDFMLNQLEVLSQYVPYRQWVDDDDRTEEFVRSALLHCDIFPNGETMEMAYDSLDSVSILKRNNVLNKSKAAYDRVIEIRKQMAEKKAREAANVYGRE